MRHARKCWDCKNIAYHEDNVVPHVICGKCGSQDTRATQEVPGVTMRTPWAIAEEWYSEKQITLTILTCKEVIPGDVRSE